MTHNDFSASADALEQEFASIDGYLQAVHDILTQGAMPDIRDLDDRIARLCALVEAAPNELREGCLDKLDLLLKKLGNCEDEMTAAQNARGALS